MILIDTSAWVELLRGTGSATCQAVHDLLGGDIAICDPVRVEVLAAAAMALAPKVRVNAIGPGPTLRGGRQTEEDFARQRAATVLERGASPADI